MSSSQKELNWLKQMQINVSALLRWICYVYIFILYILELPAGGPTGTYLLDPMTYRFKTAAALAQALLPNMGGATKAIYCIFVRNSDRLR